MQVIMIRIEQVKDGIRVNLDNLAREDSTDAEKALADTLEQLYGDIARKLGSVNVLPGTRYKEPS